MMWVLRHDLIAAIFAGAYNLLQFLYRLLADFKLLTVLCCSQGDVRVAYCFYCSLNGLQRSANGEKLQV